MAGTAKNYDVLCYHLKVVHNSLDTPLKKELEFFLEGIEADLFQKNGTLYNSIERKFPVIFNIRLQALKWMASEDQNLAEVLETEAYPYFEQTAGLDRLAGLSENILFALRCNRKVAAALLKNAGREELSQKHFPVLPNISFDQFIASVDLAAPTPELAKSTIEWAKCSLCIEYVICAAAIVFDKKILLPEKRIEELSAVVVNAAQTYIAIAAELGIIPQKKAFAFSNSPEGNPDFIKEQKILAEAGIGLFAQNWSD